MPAHSKEFPWPSHYGRYGYFAQRMEAHSSIASVIEISEPVYELTLGNGKQLRVFICECYSYGIAEYIETIETLGRFDVIIINSVWCSYTNKAKRMARDQKVGLFDIAEFMAALNTDNIWSYLDEDTQKIFKENGWL